MNNQPRCPDCGKFQESEPDGYYGKLDPDDDLSGVEVFCDHYCYEHYQWKTNQPKTNHTKMCEEYWDRGLDCQCIPEGVKQAIRNGANPDEVM